MEKRGSSFNKRGERRGEVENPYIQREKQRGGIRGEKRKKNARTALKNA